MRLGLALIFIAVPLIELALLLKIGQSIGLLWTLFVIIVTAIVGTWVLHVQGFAVMRRSLESLQAGKPPIGPAVDGMFLLFAGTLLLTPGFLSDILGLLLLLPPLRHAIAAWSIRRILRSGAVRTTIFGEEFERARERRERGDPSSRSQANSSHAPTGDGPIIDGEFERLGERTVDRGARKS
jgi:UPF0716 protein FxsA